jgi:tRNA-splicing ligase RtcB
MDGNDLINMGYKPGPHFKEMIDLANVLSDNEESFHKIRSALDEIYEEAVLEMVTIPLKTTNLGYYVFLDEGKSEFEISNIESTKATMHELMKTPTIIRGMLMPDACPAGPLGTIPVGGVAVTQNAIHPGMHSADICCSMYLTSFDKEVPIKKIMDAVQSESHFGYGGRKDLPLADDHPISRAAAKNMFLKSVPIKHALSDHLGTQGDGNHFFNVGRRSNGNLTLVTHHGSRKPGALLYKAGMKVAEKFRVELSPDTLKQNAWIPFDTDEGKEYWDALQIIRDWTKLNHTIIHDLVLKAIGLSAENITDRFWNEHNFVFKRGDEFWHAKGSTPVYGSHADDADSEGRTIIPLNMGEPILIVKNGASNNFGFAPHGAGRNYSRTKYKKSLGDKTVEQAMSDQVSHIDARFYSGDADITELPDAYKNADDMINQINKYSLAQIVEKIEPLGSMMAGEQYQPWLKKNKLSEVLK